MHEMAITAAEGEAYHRLHQAIQQHLIKGEQSFLHAGRRLIEMQDKGVYRGGGFESFHTYLKEGDLNISWPHAYRLIRAVRNTLALIERAKQEPLILATVADGASIIVDESTVAPLAERAVLSMGITKADKVLARVLQAEDAESARAWIDRGRELREVDVDREVARERRGGEDDPLYDFLVGIRRRGHGLFNNGFMQLAPHSPTEVDLEDRLQEIENLVQEVREWVRHYERERSTA